MSAHQAVALPPYLFGEQRKLCERCMNLRRRGATTMGCAAAPGKAKGGNEVLCLDARADDGWCGPDGRRFAPA